jgi:hypothetical protein
LAIHYSENLRLLWADLPVIKMSDSVRRMYYSNSGGKSSNADAKRETRSRRGKMRRFEVDPPNANPKIRF